MKMQQYDQQLELLLACLPAVGGIKNFALKGGTAINLFARSDFPRVSVDLDLTFCPVIDRNSSLVEIEQGLQSIAKQLNKLKNVIVMPYKNIATTTITKLIVTRLKTSIYIEVNFIVRGHVLPVVKLDLATKVQDLYGVAILDQPILAIAELYGSKICAALDRQHPRDLFDIKLLLEDLGFTLEIKQAFLIYLLSSNRPMNELLNPNLIDQRQAYTEEFLGMTDREVTYENLLDTREQLITEIHQKLTAADKEFLLSIKRGVPDWTKFAFPEVELLPSVQWKLQNIARMDKAKHADMLKKLEKVLYG